MRLLDRVANGTRALAYREDATAAPVRLASAADWAHVVRACPVRYVLTDPLTALCTSLACADGDRLQGCLDLVRAPAELLWVEWNDTARSAALPPGIDRGDARPGPAGALVHATPDGRSGRLRTFWAEGTDGEPRMAAMETWFDLDAPDGPAVPGPATEVFRVTDDDPALETLYSRLRFRLEPSWARYYARAGLDAGGRAAVVHACLEGVVRDLPMLFALFLLTNARDAIGRRPVARAAVNRLRAARGEPALLDHVEVHASLFGAARGAGVDAGGHRRAPRLHHVRGHLVRRQDRVYWRVPHLRGHATAGIVRSRTVTLRFGSAGFSPDPSLR